MSTRAYKNAKFNGNTKKNYAYTPEYIAHRFTRGGSVKTAYCDHNYVGDVESTFSLKRSPAVYKGASCEFVYNPPPEAGPAGLALEIIKPEAGPVGITLENIKPEAGPTGIDLEHMAPVAGPVGVSVDNLNPSAGPTDLSLEHLKPQAGPVGIDVTAIKPQAGPIGIDLELLAPSAGPVGINLGVAKPVAGPVDANTEILKPQEGPVDIALHPSPIAGPVNVLTSHLKPEAGPTGTTLFEYKQPVVSSTGLHSINWEPLDGVAGYEVYIYEWGMERHPMTDIDLDTTPADDLEPFLAMGYLSDAWNMHLVTQDGWEERPGGGEGTWYWYRPDINIHLTHNKYIAHQYTVNPLVYGPEVTSSTTIANVRPDDVAGLPFTMCRVGAKYPDGYVSLSEPFFAFVFDTDIITSTVSSKPDFNEAYIKTHGYAYYEQFDTGVEHPDFPWMNIVENRIRGFITDTGIMKEIEVNAFNGTHVVTFPGSVTGLTETEYVSAGAKATSTLHYSIREYLDLLWTLTPTVSNTNPRTEVTHTTEITQDVKDRVLAGMIHDIDEKVITIPTNDYVIRTLDETIS